MEKIPKLIMVAAAIAAILLVVLTLPPADVKKPITLVENQTACAKEGETVGAEAMAESCCSGLTPVGGWPGGYDGDCSLLAPPTGLLTCSDCGDGTCDEHNGENKCNCPEDCETGCAKEGERITTMPLPDGAENEGCCNGLSAIPDARMFDGKCSFMTDVAICADCGNGECGAGENSCNCPEDCKNQSAEGELMFRKSYFWGPCPPGEVCNEETLVYVNGRIVEDGTVYYVSTADIEDISDAIEDSGILSANCSVSEAFDVNSEYEINLRGVKRAIEDPGQKCVARLGQVNKVIDDILENSIPASHLEIHEWGVLGGCEHNETYFVTSRPEIMMAVDLPVVYVHSEGLDKFSAGFSFQEGVPTDTYPSAEIDPENYNIVQWKDVLVNPQVDEVVNIAEVDFIQRIPLEDLIPTLNNVDSDTLYYNGEETKFLFYEGEILFENKVDVSFDVKARTATFKNTGDYAVHNLMLAHMIGSYMNATTLLAAAGDLVPGEEKTVELKEQDGSSLVEADMLSMGFTQKETNAFLSVWGPAFFYPGNLGFTQVIYRLPQSEYDSMLPAKIDPEPDKMIRAMYVLVDVSE